MSVGRPPLAEILPDAFPWIRLFTNDEQVTFAQEFVEVMETGDAVGRPASVLQLITEWRHTAEIYADPELLKALRSEEPP